MDDRETEAAEMITKEARSILSERRETLRQMYARFMEFSKELRGKSLIRYNKDRRRFEDCIHAAGRSVSFKERTAVVTFIKLQRNIAEQAMLLLELEHAIDYEERKGLQVTQTSTNLVSNEK